MLSQEDHPVAWAMLLYELADAHEHLGALIAPMQAAGGADEAEFAVHLGHVYAHLNRAWHGRCDPNLDAVPGDQQAVRSQYPTDLPPDGYNADAQPDSAADGGGT
jgi:hypothetical protein